jgi:hypothetical protein
VAKTDVPNPSPNLTHLWRAYLTIGAKIEMFHFRAPDDCALASSLASILADQSQYITMKAARLVKIECLGRLLN